MNRCTIWEFQEHQSLWTQQNKFCWIGWDKVLDTELNPGIYCMVLGKKIVYVGETGSSKLQRIRRGFTVGLHHGGAYKWRDQPILKDAMIKCIYFDSRAAMDSLNNEDVRKGVEFQMAKSVEFLNSEPLMFVRGLSPRPDAFFIHDSIRRDMIEHLQKIGYLPPWPPSSLR